MPNESSTITREDGVVLRLIGPHPADPNVIAARQVTMDMNGDERLADRMTYLSRAWLESRGAAIPGPQVAEATIAPMPAVTPAVPVMLPQRDTVPAPAQQPA